MVSFTDMTADGIEKVKLPLISIVIPSWQSGEFLEMALLSVLIQDYKNVEIILVDNESTDQTIDIIEKYRHQFSHIIREPDNGQSDAINKGMRLATGDVLAWLNADDVLLEGCLTRVANTFQNNRPDIITAHTIYIDELNKIGKFCLQPSQNSFFYSRGIFFLTAPAIFFSRDAFLDVGCLSNSLKLSMDVDLCYKILRGGGTVFHIREYCGAFRWHDNSKTSKDLADRSTRENSETISIFDKYAIPNYVRVLANRLHQIRLILLFYPARRKFDAFRYRNKFTQYFHRLERNCVVMERIQSYDQ
jgi:glycosyltransferase involved in cell wall biosynthesis